MAVKDAKIRFLERELAEREQELQTMKEGEYVPVVETDDSRVRELEKKVNEVDALVKGLVNEVLDLKSIVMKLSRQTEERGRRIVETGERKAEVRKADPQRIEAVQKKELVAEPRRAGLKAAAAQEPPQEAGPGEKMDLIMQTDGTLKPERRSSSTYIVASGNYNNRPMGGKKGGSAPMRTKGRGDVDDLIQAEDDDTQEIKKK
jgi:hypothetical protein